MQQQLNRDVDRITLERGGCSEGASTGKDACGNGCGWVRPEATAREEEKQVYNAGTFSADTM